jgi:hypothetical protein
MGERDADGSDLTPEGKVRLRFQREHCSITEKSRLTAISAAVRRYRAKTGGRKHDPHRPFPDADRLLAKEMTEYADRLEAIHHPLAAIAKATSADMRHCMVVEGHDHQPCNSTACSRCRAEMADSGRELGESLAGEDLAGIPHNRIRATTILLFATPITDRSDDPVGLASRVSRHMQIIHERAIRSGFRFVLLPEIKILEPGEVMRNHHHRAYVEAILPEWDWSTRVLVAHLHGLVILPETDDGRTLHALRQAYPLSRAVLLKRLHEKQRIDAAISCWMKYSAEQEARHDIPIRENNRLAKLYRASDFLLIDQIIQNLAEDISIFEWSGYIPEDPDRWTWEEILEDIREVSARAQPHPTSLRTVYVVYYSGDEPVPPDWSWYNHGNRIIRPLRSWSGPRGPPRRVPRFRETKLICISRSASHALYLFPRHDASWRNAHHFFVMMARIDRAKMEAE